MKPFWSPVFSCMIIFFFFYRTILLSVISLLNEPNTFSPANVDASIMFRRWQESKGKDKEYEQIIKKQVSKSRSDAEKEGISIPTTVEEYCIKTKPESQSSENFMDLTDDWYEDMDEYDDYDEECFDNSDDSGNEDS